MTKEKLLRKAEAVLLTVAMTVGSMTGLPIGRIEARAETTNTEPEITQFATKAQLMTKFDLEDSTDAKVQKVIFGQNGSDGTQEWKIAGKDPYVTGDNIVLFAASPLIAKQAFSESEKEKEYVNGTENQTVYANHYGASDLRDALIKLSTNAAYFNNNERKLMNQTTINTNDTKNNSTYSTKDVLYAAYGVHHGKYITVGTNGSSDLNDGIRIDIDNWGTVTFWLRSPDLSNRLRILRTSPYSDGVYYGGFDSEWAVVPAFNLNLSSVIFASAVPVVSSDESLTVGDIFTLRYEAHDIGTAKLNASQTKISVTNAKDNYLVVQNRAGAWAKKITKDSEVISASSLNSGLKDFENCKVWIEKTTAGITSATLAVEGSGNDVSIFYGDTMTTTGNIDQSWLTNAMTDVTFTAVEGYYFPEGYVSTVTSTLNGISITRDGYSSITISGTPTAASTEITLPAATAKEKEGTPKIEIDYITEKLTGFATGPSYTIGGDDVSPVSGEVGITDSYLGTTISIVKKTSDVNTRADSDAQSLSVSARRAEPNVKGVDETIKEKNDGQITGTTTAMQYKSSTADSWENCEGSSITGLSPATYYVRFKAVENTSFAGASKEVIIAEGPAEKILIKVGDVTFDEQTEGYSTPTEKVITISNDTENGANTDATIKTVRLTGDDKDSFTVSGSGNSWTVQPKEELTANADGTPKTYEATINVDYNATTGTDNPATATVSFTVKRNPVNGVTADLSTDKIYTENQKVSLSCATAGAEIRYTTDGTDPDQNSDIYENPIEVTGVEGDGEYITTIKAIAYKEGQIASGVATFTYKINIPQGYDITVNEPEHERGTATADKTRAPEGTTITLTAKANKGWKFKGWSVVGTDTETITSLTDANTTFEMPAEAVNISAEFVEAVISKLTIVDGTGSGNYEEGEKVTIKATERTDYVFKKWQMEEGSSDAVIASPSNATTTVTMGTQDTVITAIFDYIKDIINDVIDLIIKKEPAKTTYKLTEEFNPTGLVVQAKGVASPSNAEYTYTLSEDSDGYELDTSDFDSSQPGEYKIHVKYTYVNGDDVEKNFDKSFTVEVKDEYPDDEETYVSEIKIKTKPVKQTYYTDDDIDLTGLVVIAKQKGIDSGESKDDKILTADEYDVDYDFSIPGTRKVTILYYDGGKDGDKTCRATFTVKVLRRYSSDNDSDDSNSSSSNSTTSTASPWSQTGTNVWQYKKSDGTYAVNEWVLVTETGKDVWYYFTPEARMHTGWLTDSKDGHHYYLDPASGRMVTGWVMIDGAWYYFNETQSDESGWFYDAVKKEWAYVDKGRQPLGMWMEGAVKENGVLEADKWGTV